MALISIADAESLAARALERAGASTAAAQATARALVYAEAQGTVSHGLSRVAQYAGHMGAGRVDGKATAVVRREQGATVIVDAADGLAFPRAYEREHLADNIMAFDRNPVSTSYLDHVFESREGARGATGSAGGGCGCN